MHLLQQFFSPLLSLGFWLIRALPFWVCLLLVLYLTSNVQIVPADQRAMVFRFGALVHQGTPQAEQGPGLMFAFPAPIDRVELFSANKVHTLEVQDLHLPNEPARAFSTKTLDPEQVGYILSADQNLLHVRLSVQYQVSSAEDYFVHYDAPQKIMRSIVLATTVLEAGKRSIDDILTDGRDQWMRSIHTRSQKRMDAQELGVKIISLEIVDLQVPSAVRSDFQAVQSAVVDAQTLEQEAKAYRAEQIPKAKTWANNEVNGAQSDALLLISNARAENEAFLSLITDDPKLLKTRIYRERLQSIFEDIGSVRFVPPPTKNGMRITVREGR